MIDLLHFGICTGTPIIFEGSPGQGKQKAINYISELLDYDVENIIITSDFSVNDLFKKNVLVSNDDGTFSVDIVNTKLGKILSKSRSKFGKKLYEIEMLSKNADNSKEKNDSQRHTIFAFHNIHKASADVLSRLSSLFNDKSVDTNYSFVGIIDIKESFVERDSYYYTYFYNSIYYVVKSINIDISFCEQLLQPKDIEISILKYFKNSEKNDDINFSLTDLKKFISLKKCSNFDDSFLEEIIFKNRYNYNRSNKEQISNKTSYFDINYKNQINELILQYNGKSISLGFSEILSTIEAEKNTLSYEQRKCLIVLGLAVKAKLPCILQGPTGIGKSHLIKLFARIFGKKLNIINLNKDNDI